MRHSGGEYRCSDVDAPDPECRTLWMREASNVKPSPARNSVTAWSRLSDHQSLLGDLTADDPNRTGREIVVVQAGVLGRHPADQPRLEVMIAAQAKVVALGDRVRLEVAATGRGCVGQRIGQRGELIGLEVAIGDLAPGQPLIEAGRVAHSSGASVAGEQSGGVLLEDQVGCARAERVTARRVGSHAITG